jgi:CspA family cold shock protein
MHGAVAVRQTNDRSVPMTSGTVKFYNDQKGFGFIAPEDGSTDVFVHATALERSGMRMISEGQKVSFTVAKDQRSGKMAVDTIQEG